MEKNEVQVVVGLAAFAVVVGVLKRKLTRKHEAQEYRRQELQILVNQLEHYARKNLTNDDVSVEEYHDRIKTEIEFINMVRYL